MVYIFSSDIFMSYSSKYILFSNVFLQAPGVTYSTGLMFGLSWMNTTQGSEGDRVLGLGDKSHSFWPLCYCFVTLVKLL